MKKLLTQNSKLKKTSKITGIKTFDFAIPAKKTCPFAKDCLKYCYASKSCYNYPVVKNKLAWNLKQTKGNFFIDDILNQIIDSKIEAVRIHSSGDFYSREYLKLWLTIAKLLPFITFYCYTKSIPYFKNKKLPDNFVVIYSFGGVFDSLIDIKKDRHAIVYDNRLPDGYSYANDNDHIALANNKKIGLKKH